MNRLFGNISNLARRGVLGLNARNADYIMRHNPRRLYPLVDDKLLTKRLALEAGMAVPELYGTVRTDHEASQLGELLASLDQFVIKPAHGSGGDGILVVSSRSRGNRFRLINGQVTDIVELQHHVSNIISGQYSLGGNPDVALVEYCVRFDPLFNQISYLGVPDIRVIVYQGYPVMAMVRLPTRQSGGKANLHQGAIGAGIFIGSGETSKGVLGHEVIEDHPDTGHRIEGITVPDWPGMLALAARCSEVVGLGYLGVDIVLDRDKGPLILELNARPGLNIQIANRVGLKNRLQLVDDLKEHELDHVARVQRSREMFAN